MTDTRKQVARSTVRMRGGELVSSLDHSTTLRGVPVVSIDYVFVDRSMFDEAKAWLDFYRIIVITPKAEGTSDG